MSRDVDSAIRLEIKGFREAQNLQVAPGRAILYTPYIRPDRTPAAHVQASLFMTPSRNHAHLTSGMVDHLPVVHQTRLSLTRAVIPTTRRTPGFATWVVRTIRSTGLEHQQRRHQ